MAQGAGLTGNAAAGNCGGDVHLAPVVPLGQAQGEALGVGAIGGAAVDATVVLGHQDGLVLEGGGDVHMVGLQSVN